MVDMGVLTAASESIYQYLNFDRIETFTDAAAGVKDAATAA
jgi:aconitate hydratase 2 / 2-methylisocitrate dehydratase